MMRPRFLVLLLVAASLALAAPCQARWRHHHRFDVAVSLGWGAWFGWPGWYMWADAPHAVGFLPPDAAAVDTDVEPEHARVYLDGELLGTADDFDGYPEYLLLRPGHYTLEFRLGGYRSESLEIDARPGRFFPVDLKLARIPGEAATPWYDRPDHPPLGQVYGPAHKPDQKDDRGGPDARLRPELRGKEAESRAEPRSEPQAEPRGEPEAQPQDDSQPQPQAESQPQPQAKSESRPQAESQPQQQAEPQAERSARGGAAVDLRVTPSNASVYLDGEFLGTGEELERLERGFAVTPGQHRLEVVAPGHNPRSLDVLLRPGERQQVIIELEKTPAGGGTGQRD